MYKETIINETTCLERPHIVWQKDLHCNITEPVTRDTVLWLIGWSFRVPLYISMHISDCNEIGPFK